MKKVLILAYDFPPFVSVGGLRPYSWYKYFKEFGIYPVVVTRQWTNKYGNGLDYVASGWSDDVVIEQTDRGTIIRTPYRPNLANKLLIKYEEKRFRIIRKMITAYYEFMQWLFFIGPKVEIYKAAKQFLSKNKVDVIIATGEPFILFRYASVLSKKYNIPWIADYRDPWTEVIGKYKIKMFFDKFFERKYLSNTVAITTVSEMVKRLIKKNVKQDISFGIFINGYDEENLKNDIYPDSNKTLIITYAGTLYNWHPLEETFKVFDKLIASGIKLNIKFIGVSKSDRINKALSICANLKQNVTVLPRLSNNKLFEELYKSHLLLLYNDNYIAGTKIYDYLASKRPVLLCFTNDKDANILRKKYFPLPSVKGVSEHLQADILAETNGGVAIRDKHHLEEVIINYWEELISTDKIKCESKNIERFSRNNTAKQFVEYLNKLI